MENIFYTRLVLLTFASLCTLLPVNATADTQQELLTMNADIGLNPMLGRVHMNTNPIPISVITDSSGQIASIVFGDKDSRMNYSDLFGDKNGTYDIPVASFSMDQLHNPVYITEKLLGKDTNLAMIDGSKLDPKTGGDFTIGMPVSVLTPGRLQLISLTIKKDPISGKWLAYQKDHLEKAVTSISIGSSMLGFGVGSPKFTNGSDALQTLNSINQSIAPGACQGVGICLTYYKDGSVLLSKGYKQAEDFQKDPAYAIPLTGPAAATAGK